MKNDNTHKGMKFTEVGWIPEDWEIKEIQNVAPLQRGFDLPTQSIVDGTYPVVYSNGILNYHKEAPCQAPGLVTGRSGTIGKFFFIPEGGYWPHNTTLWVTTFKGNYPLYIKYLYETVGFENFSTGTGVPTLNRNELHIYKVALPSSPSEQKRIASVLSDMDSLISSLSSTIEKKRLIKKGTMQQLLSGETRLKGYTEKWVEKSIGDVLKIGHGKDYKHLKPGPYPVYGTGGYMTSVSEYIYDGESVCIGRKGTINRPIFLQGKFWTVDTLFYTHSFKGVIPLFIYYIFNTIDWNSLNEATGVPSLTAKNIENVIFLCPKDKNEQHAIASRLTTMDDEILALEKELEKYKVLKQGMMQKLLTGQIRLKYKDIAYN